MGTAQVAFAEERWGATGSDVSGSPMTGHDVNHRNRKYVLRMRNRKLHNIRPSGAFWPEVTSVTWPEVACPEVALSWSMFCACPAFSPRFFLSSSNMATGCDQKSVDPFGVSLGVRMHNRKLCNTRSSSKQCWLGCSLRRPRPITIGNPASYI